jgi:hypothetical protein
VEYRRKVVEYITNLGINVQRVEQEGNNESIVCHIPKEDNNKITDNQSKIESDLNSAVLLSNSYGMNVVVIESNNIDEE